MQELDERLPDKMTIVLKRRPGYWVAQCMEHDIASKGPDFTVAIAHIAKMIMVQSYMDKQEKKDPKFKDIEPASKLKLKNILG